MPGRTLRLPMRPRDVPPALPSLSRTLPLPPWLSPPYPLPPTTLPRSTGGRRGGGPGPPLAAAVELLEALEALAPVAPLDVRGGIGPRRPARAALFACTPTGARAWVVAPDT